MRLIKYFSFLVLSAFIFFANASIHLDFKKPLRSPTTHAMSSPAHTWLPCGTYKKQTKGPRKNTPYEVAKGYTCHPRLQKDSNRRHIAPHSGHHPEHMEPTFSFEKCRQSCPSPYIREKCSKGEEYPPQIPSFVHRPGYMTPLSQPIPHVQPHK